MMNYGNNWSFLFSPIVQNIELKVKENCESEMSVCKHDCTQFTFTFERKGFVEE